MRKIPIQNKVRKQDILIFLAVFFNILAIITIALYISHLSNNEIYKFITLIVPVASPIILYFALRQSIMSNDIRNSQIFFEEEKRNIDRLVEIGSENHYSKLTGIIKEYRIPLKKEVTYLNITDSFIVLQDKLVGNQEHYDEYAANWKTHQGICVAFENYFEFRNGYYKFLNLIRREIDNINNLHQTKSLVRQHRDLLFRKMYRLVENFFSYYGYYSTDTREIKNAKVPNRRAPNSYTTEQLFLFDYTDQKYNKLKFLEDYGFNVID